MVAKRPPLNTPTALNITKSTTKPGTNTSAYQVRLAIDTVCQLREAEAQMRKCQSRADRSTDVSDIRVSARREATLAKKCATLRARMNRVERDVTKRPDVRRELERRFDRGWLATSRSSMRGVWGSRCSDADIERTDGVAGIGGGWFVPVAKISDLATAKRVVEYVEKGRPSTVCDPAPAVPPSVHLSESVATLQNLPTWQRMRIALLSCYLSNVQRPRRDVVPRWAAALGINGAYTAPLEAMQLILSEEGRCQPKEPSRSTRRGNRGKK